LCGSYFFELLVKRNESQGVRVPRCFYGEKTAVFHSQESHFRHVRGRQLEVRASCRKVRRKIANKGAKMGLKSCEFSDSLNYFRITIAAAARRERPVLPAHHT
jgi:hypothetical protein